MKIGFAQINATVSELNGEGQTNFHPDNTELPRLNSSNEQSRDSARNCPSSLSEERKEIRLKLAELDPDECLMKTIR